MRKFRPLPVFAAWAVMVGAFAFLAASAAAQDVPKKNLRLLQEIPVRLPPSLSPLAEAPQCDNNGALYFRARQDGSSTAQKTPVVEVSSTGFTSRTFSLSTVPGYDLSTTASVTDFLATGDGQVYFLASKAAINGPDPELDLIHFSSGARYVSTLRLSHFFLPRRFALLAGGSYFLLALDRDFSLPGQARTFVESSFVYPVGLFFNPAGKLVREIALPDTAKPVLSTVAATTAPTTPDPPGDADPAFVATSYDGTIYVMRHTRDLAVYVITDSGATVNSITIQPPFPDAVATGIASDGPGKFVIEFARRTQGGGTDDSHAVFSLIDADSGIRLADYQATAETTGSLGCTTPVGFELLSRQSGGSLVIRFVSTK